MTQDTVSCAVYCRAVPASCSGQMGDREGSLAILPSSPLPERGGWTLKESVVIDLGQAAAPARQGQRGRKRNGSTMSQTVLHIDAIRGLTAGVSSACRLGIAAARLLEKSAV